jgi:secreted PhoX family phosphatase
MRSLTRIGLALLFVALLSPIGFAQSGVISTVVGNGTGGFSGDSGQATSAQISQPVGVAVDAAGNLFIADHGNNRVRKVTPSGVISTVAGNGFSGFSGDGGPTTSAQLSPWEIAVDMAGNLFIADSDNNRVRKVTPGGVISTVAGNGASGFSGDGGPATAAQINSPTGLAVDMVGNLFIVEEHGYRVRKVTPSGIISTVAGSGISGFGGDGGPATSAQLN